MIGARSLAGATLDEGLELPNNGAVVSWMTGNIPTGTAEKALIPDLPCRWFYDPAVRDLCKKAREQGDLTQDEILLLAIAAGQAAYVRYIEPDSAHDAEQTLDEIAKVLDHDAVGAATHAKAVELLKRRESGQIENSAQSLD